MAMQTLPHAWAARTPSLTAPASALTVAEEGIQETCDHVAEAWSRGDAADMAAALAPDCDHVTLTRVRQVKRGRAALVDSWRKAFARRSPSFSVRMSVATHNVRLIGDEVALVDGAFEYSEGIGAADIHQSRSSQAFTAVMVRQDVEWLVLALRVGPSTAAAKVVPCLEEVSSYCCSELIPRPPRSTAGSSCG
jgi:uncharacterized protein (TIGR02246 family)